MEPMPEYPAEIRVAHIAARQRRVEPVDFNARRARMEYLRGWQRLAASGHVGAQAVLSHRDVQDELRAHHERVSNFAHLLNRETKNWP
jgi:hypothetical protein